MYEPPEQFRQVKSDVLREHVHLLIEHGLVTAIDVDSGFMRLRLTWNGHDFAGAGRMSEVWEKTKQVAGNLPFDIFRSVLSKLALDHVPVLLDKLRL